MHGSFRNYRLRLLIRYYPGTAPAIIINFNIFLITESAASLFNHHDIEYRAIGHIAT